MSDKIDFREMTRNFLLGEAEGDANSVVANNVIGGPQLLKEGEDRRVQLVREAVRLRNTFNSTEIEFLIEEITRR